MVLLQDDAQFGLLGAEHRALELGQAPERASAHEPARQASHHPSHVRGHDERGGVGRLQTRLQEGEHAGVRHVLAEPV